MKPWRCVSCKAEGDDGGFVAGRAHLDVCPEREEAEVRGFKRSWALYARCEVGWIMWPLNIWLASKWNQFPPVESAESS